MKGFRGGLPYLCPAALSLGMCFTLGISICAADIPGYPESVEGYDSRELAKLPGFCIYTLAFRAKLPAGNNPSEIERLTREMGPSFNNMHHYCWGLMKTNRAIFLARTQQDRRFYLGSAINEFDYVIQRAPPDFVLLPEILTRKGENLIRLDRGPEGMSELRRAIQIKADYWPTYAAMSDYYKENGEPAKAREWLEKGLTAAPDTRALTRRLAELDSAKSKRKNDPQPRVDR